MASQSEERPRSETAQGGASDRLGDEARQSKETGPSDRPHPSGDSPKPHGDKLGDAVRSATNKSAG